MGAENRRKLWYFVANADTSAGIGTPGQMSASSTAKDVQPRRCYNL
jgi:hypothetical protein